MDKYKCKSCGTELDNTMKYTDFIEKSESWFTHYSPLSVCLLVPDTEEWREKVIQGAIDYDNSMNEVTFSTSRKITTPFGIIDRIYFVKGIEKPISVLR